ncbi:hypothetical protein SAMN05660297_02865 [Natronincola peptidivorans]|uniref:DUF2784 domain-containing protein n=1 Tax=Natronincola peptidivorans TaxID=426128 RepID=A0A1I0FMR0_9FIRM|nr:hypothetical protein [Natronincola peptidivorans]SET59361.1 hypothetical protein SAMN05660297_02865 [Natronincola peptidivorans]
MGKSKNQSFELLIIKVIHTIIWTFFVLIIFYILYTAIIDEMNLYTWVAIVLVIVEGCILLINGWRCPLTNIGKKYTSNTEVGFDIFLPKWLAKNNKTILTTIYLIGIMFVIYRLLT